MDNEQEFINAAGLVGCSNCGHTIETNHDTTGCDTCNCRASWNGPQKREYRALLGLPRRWRR